MIAEDVLLSAVEVAPRPCKQPDCRRAALPDWAYCESHRSELVLAAFRPCRPDDYPPFDEQKS